MISKMFRVGKVILALLDACPLARDLVMQIGEWARVSMKGVHSTVWVYGQEGKQTLIRGACTRRRDATQRRTEVCDIEGYSPGHRCVVVLSRAFEWRIPKHLHFPDHGLSLFNGKTIRAQSSAEKWHHGSTLIII